VPKIVEFPISGFKIVAFDNPRELDTNSPKTKKIPTKNLSIKVITKPKLNSFKAISVNIIKLSVYTGFTGL
jgi:hypothetical protein